MREHRIRWQKINVSVLQTAKYRLADNEARPMRVGRPLLIKYLCEKKGVNAIEVMAIA
jgi:hypothetical protein